MYTNSTYQLQIYIATPQDNRFVRNHQFHKRLSRVKSEQNRDRSKRGEKNTTYTCVQMYTGWRRLIGCLELQVIFRKRATNYRALLRKMTYESKAPYDTTPPCTDVHQSYERLCKGNREQNWVRALKNIYVNIYSTYIHVYICIYTNI